MKVIPINRKAALMLAATLAAGTAFAADQVERDDTAAPPAPPAAAAPAVPPAPPAEKSAGKTQLEKDQDKKLREAQKRLEAAAAEVAALSSEIASEAMQNFGSMWAGAGPRRSIIGVQIEAAESGSGAKVRDVSPGGAAEAAGIRVGDVIVAVNGTTVKDGAREVVRMLRAVEPESTVTVRVMRDGKPKEFKVTARKYDARTFVYSPPDMDFNFDFDSSPWTGFGPSPFRGALAGMEITTLTPQLARYFGADEGLLVLRAPKGDTYKLQDGDVILNIDGRVPTSGSHVTRILRSYQPGEKLTLHIMRDRKPMDLQITLPEDERARRTRAARNGRDDTPL